MLGRREFIALPLVLAARPNGLRTISYNILACLGFPETEANRARFKAMQPQQPMRLALELELYQPDLITFQESVSRDVAQQIASALKMNLAYFPAAVPSYPGSPLGYPGTLLTRFRVIESQNFPGKNDDELYTTHWGRALIATPSEVVVVFSAHLHPRSSDIRSREIDGILREVEKDMRKGRSLLLQGDLNHPPDSPEYQRWVAAGLIDTFAVKGAGQPYTSKSIAPHRRIDYIWAHGPIAKRLTEARCLFEGAFRTNPQDPQSIALSDHLPVMAVFS